MRSDWSRSLSALLVAALLVAFPSGCSRGSSPGVGSLETNSAYWNGLSGIKLPAYALDSLNIEGATTLSRAQLLRFRAFCQLEIDALSAQNTRIAALPRTDVDAKLLDYAGELTSTNAAKLAALSELRYLLEGISMVDDGSDWIVALVPEMVRHARENEILIPTFNADAYPRARPLAQKVEALQVLQARSIAAENAARERLLGRFGQEFSPRPAAPVPDPSTSGPPSPKTIDAQRMKFDLIGREVSGWEFEALDEFVTFEVRQSRTDSQVAVFGVVAKVRGARSGTTQEVSFAIGYKSEPHGWRFMRLSPN